MAGYEDFGNRTPGERVELLNESLPRARYEDSTRPLIERGSTRYAETKTLIPALTAVDAKPPEQPVTPNPMRRKVINWIFFGVILGVCQWLMPETVMTILATMFLVAKQAVEIAVIAFLSAQAIVVPILLKIATVCFSMLPYVAGAAVVLAALWWLIGRIFR